MANAAIVSVVILVAATVSVIGGPPPAPYECINKRIVFYSLPELRYGLDELLPFIPTTTAKEHYFGIHFLYVSKMNNIIQVWRRSVSDVYVPG